MEETAAKQSQKPKTSTRLVKFVIVGITLALANYVIFTSLDRLVFNNKDLLWIDSIISCTLAAILAYILHSKITWKERTVTSYNIVMFFIWNGLLAIAISPFFTWLFGHITPLYEFIFNITQNIGLPFDYQFIESTGIFCLVTAVTMILNFIFYDKLVFGAKPTKEENDKK